jgi:putative transposase
MDQIHVRPMYPQTQGKIERYHRTMKNVVKLDNYYAPEELEKALEKFVHRYNNKRYHESLNNLTLADVYYGRGDLILKEIARLKRVSLHKRRMEYQQFKMTKKSENKKK